MYSNVLCLTAYTTDKQVIDKDKKYKREQKLCFKKFKMK